jgi:hypothetical protein
MAENRCRNIVATPIRNILYLTSRICQENTREEQEEERKRKEEEKKRRVKHLSTHKDCALLFESRHSVCVCLFSFHGGEWAQIKPVKIRQNLLLCRKAYCFVEEDDVTFFFVDFCFFFNTHFLGSFLLSGSSNLPTTLSSDDSSS